MSSPARSPSGESTRRAAQIEVAWAYLEQGRPLAVPSECGYRVVCRGDNEGALRRVYECLHRNNGRPLSLYVAEGADLAGYASDVSNTARNLMQAFFPGPLTLLLGRGERTHSIICADLAKVAMRCPYHPSTQELLRRMGYPLAGAALRGQAGLPVTSRAQAQSILGADIEVLPCKDSVLGLDSTVVDATRDPVRVLRSGFVTSLDLQRVVDHRPVFGGDRTAPYRMQRDSPAARLIVVEGSQERVPRRLRTLLDTYALTERVALLLTRETADGAFSDPPRGLAHLSVLGSRDCPEDIDEALTAVLGRLDKDLKATVVLVEGLPREGDSARTMERLCRQAHQVINTEDPGYSGQAGLRPRRRPTDLQGGPGETRI